MGTAAYFSPEQAEGKGVDARSDIYSLGVVLYEAAVGRPPFSGDSPVAVASKHVRDAPMPPREVNPAVPAALEAVIMKAMAKNPDARYASAEEFRADLLRFADGRPVEAVDAGVTSVMAAAGVTSVMTSTGRTMAVPPAAVPPGGRREDDGRRRRTGWLIALLVLLLVALGVIAFFLLRSLGNVNVPDVVGQTEANATTQLQNAHLTVGHVTSRESAEAKGLVLSTEPKAGASVSRNSAVNLVVSSGPNIPMVAVPSVKGMPLAQALQLIQAAGLTATTTYISSNQPVGTVLDQTPAGGTQVKVTEKVHLTVSGTQTSVQVPSVIGQSPASAGSVLRGAGLGVGNQSNACSNQSSGLVAQQNPAPGANVPPNTAVNLVVSSGPCATVPSVIGQTQSQAQAAITNADLTSATTFDVACANNAAPGTVDNQNPAGGTQVPSGSSVAISVCQAQSTTTTSAPAGNSGPGGGGGAIGGGTTTTTHGHP
jgi:serine/threonine-protein kinase